jgi:hypothetical protein
MRHFLSRLRRAPRFIPTFEVLEERNPPSMLWIGAAAPTPTAAPPPPTRIARSEEVQTSRPNSLGAILTPTERLSLLPPRSDGSAGGSAATQTSWTLNPDSGPAVADPLALQLDFFAPNSGSQTASAGLTFGSSSLPGAASSAPNLAAPSSNGTSGTGGALYTPNTIGQAGDALFAAVSASASFSSAPRASATGAPNATTGPTVSSSSPVSTTAFRHNATAALFSPISSPMNANAPLTANPDGPFLLTTPLFVAPTLADPVINSSPQSFGNDPMGTSAFSDSGVRYYDGAVRLNFTDLSSDGFGKSWGQDRYWTNLTSNPAPGSPNGAGMAVSQLPFLTTTGPSQLTVVTSGTNNRVFLNLVEQGFLQDTLTHNTGASEYDFTDTKGDIFRFNDASASPNYLFKSFTDPDGNTTSVTSYSGSQVGEVQRSVTVGGVTTTESYLYSYLSSPDPNAGKESSVVLRRKVGTGSWTTIRQTLYAYYTSGQSHGNLGDLKTATIQDGSGNVLETEYYRYYTGESGGYTDALKY